MYFYISFATEEEFLGATVIKAIDPEDALRIASDGGLNPGGEAAIFGLPPDFNPQDPECVPFLGRLVGKEEMLKDHGGVRYGDMEVEQRARMESQGILIQQD